MENQTKLKTTESGANSIVMTGLFSGNNNEIVVVVPQDAGHVIFQVAKEVEIKFE